MILLPVSLLLVLSGNLGQEPLIPVYVGSIPAKPGVVESALATKGEPAQFVSTQVDSALLLTDPRDPVFRWYAMRIETWTSLATHSKRKGGVVPLRELGDVPKRAVCDLFSRLIGVSGLSNDTGEFGIGVSFQIALPNSSATRLAWSPKDQVPDVSSEAQFGPPSALLDAELPPLTGKSRIERFYSYASLNVDASLRRKSIAAAVGEFERQVDELRVKDTNALAELVKTLKDRDSIESLLNASRNASDLSSIPREFKAEFEDHLVTNASAFGLSDNEMREAALKAGGIELKPYLTFTIAFMRNGQRSVAKIDLPLGKVHTSP